VQQMLDNRDLILQTEPDIRHRIDPEKPKPRIHGRICGAMSANGPACAAKAIGRWHDGEEDFVKGVT
jgi:hypothetical protein